MGRLNILPADRMPRATCCIDGIQQLIRELEAKGAAYSADGDVYFAVAKANNYGKLSGRDPNEQQQERAVAPLMGRRAVNATPLTSRFGKEPKQANPAGSLRGDQVVRAGTSNAPRWCVRNSA